MHPDITAIPAPIESQETLSDALFVYYMTKHPSNKGLQNEDEFGKDDDDKFEGSAGENDDTIKLANLQKQILALKEKIRRRDMEIQVLKAAQELPPDEKLRALVDEAGKLFTRSDRGREVLSPRSDMLFSNLRSVGCSVEKLPEILENAFALIVGPISPEVKKGIIPSSRTIADAIGRSMATHVTLNRLHVVIVCKLYVWRQINQTKRTKIGCQCLILFWIMTTILNLIHFVLHKLILQRWIKYHRL